MLNLENQKTAITDMNLQTIGCLFWCSIPSRETWARGTFEQAMVDAGVPVEVSPALSNRSDFIRALRSMEQGRLLRLVSEDREEIVFQATKEFADGIGLSYEREAVITLDKATGLIDATDPDFAKAIRDRIGTEQDVYHSDDLRRVVRRILDHRARSIKPRSGVYFVPQSRSAWTTIVRDFLALLNLHDVGEFPLADLEDVRKQMEKIYTVEARKAIAALTDEIEALQQSGASATVLTRRFKKINELRAKAELYQDALHIEAAELDQAIGDLDTRLRQALLQ